MYKARIAWNKGITKYESKPCFCGCGELLKVHKYSKRRRGFTYSVNKFVKGHEKRGISGFNQEVHNRRICMCGCGKYTSKFRGRYNLFIKKHENVGRTAWNKNKPFSQESKKKMSVAHLGKEPANKILVDLNKIKELYFEKMLTRQETAKVLGVSIHVIKTRARLLRKKSNDPYHSREFKERMRKIGVELLKKWEHKEGPNKLEQLIYSTLDDYKIKYQKQVPLFNKFVVDAFFPEQRLILEIFGDYWHLQPRTLQKDAWKKRFLKNHGYQIEEIWEHDIKDRGANVVLSEFLENYNLI